MPLITRCPSCLTSFQVTRNQLEQASGWVRCGRCDHVFDGRDHLVEPSSGPSAADGKQPPSSHGPAPEPLKAGEPAADSRAAEDAGTGIDAESEATPSPIAPTAEDAADQPTLAEPTLTTDDAASMRLPASEDDEPVEPGFAPTPPSDGNDALPDDMPQEPVLATPDDTALGDDDDGPITEPGAAARADAHATDAVPEPQDPDDATRPATAEPEQSDSDPGIAAPTAPDARALGTASADDAKEPTLEHDAAPASAAPSDAISRQEPDSTAAMEPAFLPTRILDATPLEHVIPGQDAEPTSHPSPGDDADQRSEPTFTPDSAPASNAPATSVPAVPPPLAAGAERAAYPSVAQLLTTPVQASRAAPPVRVPPASRPPASQPTASRPTAPSFVVRAQRRAFWRHGGVRTTLWLLALVLILTLAGQWAVHERDRLAAEHPPLKPALDALCRPLGCAVAPYQKVQALSITGSNLKRLADDALALAVSVRNNESIPVAMPTLELTLTDIAEQVVVRRVLTPAELDAPAELAAGAEWSTEVGLVLATDAAGSSVVNYKLRMFYP